MINMQRRSEVAESATVQRPVKRECDLSWPLVWSLSTGVARRECWTLLDRSERLRAERFAFERDRNSYVATRATLRTLLARQLDIRPHEVRFVTNGWGKPMLAPPLRDTGIEFSVARTDGVSLIGINLGSRVGVDVERIRIVDDALRIAGVVFGPTASRQLGQRDTADRAMAFLELWTAGEAFAKAVGTGLAGLTHSLPVTLTDNPAMPISVEPGTPVMPDHGWAVLSTVIDRDYVAAVVSERPDDAPAQNSVVITRIEASALIQ